MPLKRYNTGNVEAVFFNLAPEMFITKETKWHVHLLNCRHDNNFATGLVLIETKIPSFYLNQEPFTPATPMIRVKTLWQPNGMFVPSKPFCLTLNGWN